MHRQGRGNRASRIVGARGTEHHTLGMQEEWEHCTLGVQEGWDHQALWVQVGWDAGDTRTEAGAVVGAPRPGGVLGMAG